MLAWNLQKCYRASFLIRNRLQNRRFSGISSSSGLLTKSDIDEFNGTFPRLVEELTQEKEGEEFGTLNEHLARLLEHVLPLGHKFRGLMFVGSYKTLEKERTEEIVTAANIGGWIVELCHAYLVITDDIVDRCELRRGVPTWHTKKEVGLNAINDGTFLYEKAFVLLDKYFGNHKNYTKMFELIHKVGLIAARGQVLDTIFTMNGKPNLPLYTMSRHVILCHCKTAYNTVYFPTLLALRMSDFSFTKAQHQQITDLVLKLGYFCQVRDDYIDCYEDKNGKSGNDIEEGKCTWLVVKALEKANSKQKQLIEKYYGVSDAKATSAIKNLYEELNLPKTYQGYMDELCNNIYADIRKLPKELPYEFFVKLTSYCKERDPSFVY